MGKKKVFYEKKYSQHLDRNLSSRLKMILISIGDQKASAILDVGCGDGSFSVFLKEMAEEVYGVDISLNAVNLAKEKGIKAHTIDIDDVDLPFEDDYFDIVVCGEVIEHLYDTDHLLDEIYRVLKPQGSCVLTTPNLASHLNRIVLLLGYQPYLTEVSLKYNVGKLKGSGDVSGHIRAFTHHALIELIKKHRFHIIQTLGVSIHEALPFPLSLSDRIIANILPSLATYIIVVLKK